MFCACICGRVRSRNSFFHRNFINFAMTIWNDHCSAWITAPFENRRAFCLISILYRIMFMMFFSPNVCSNSTMLNQPFSGHFDKSLFEYNFLGFYQSYIISNIYEWFFAIQNMKSVLWHTNVLSWITDGFMRKIQF